MQMIFTELKPEEFDSTFNLLKESKLDVLGLKQANIRLFRLEENGEAIGVGGLEVFDSQALLRSVAVKKDLQGKGLGKVLVGQIENAAKESGISALYLLTNTAPEFFKSIGYQQIDRDDFAGPLKQTAQFAGLCPISAIGMTKVIL
jgi:amino-acid N-acetyltransferase